MDGWEGQEVSLMPPATGYFPAWHCANKTEGFGQEPGVLFCENNILPKTFETLGRPHTWLFSYIIFPY